MDSDGSTSSTATDPGETTTTSGSTAPSTASDMPGTTEGADTAETTEPPPVSDRPAAPDFTLELGTGGEYTLSETGNPVYLVFWAEW